MKLGKALIVGVFSIAVCWAVGRFLNLNVVSFNLAGVSITRAWLVFGGGVGLFYWLGGK